MVPDARHDAGLSATTERSSPTCRAEGRPGRARWLSINAACSLLGVDQSTLRRWSDAGKVPVFRTPGGHRRYDEAALRAMVGDAPSRDERPRLDQQRLTDRSLSGYADDYLRTARGRRWYRVFGTETKEEHRRLGRRLVDLAVRYATVAPLAGDRPTLLDEGRQIGAHYGRSGAALGLTAREAVEAFLYFRHPVVEAVGRVIEEEAVAAPRAVRLFAEINVFLDQVLIATMEGHEHGRAAGSDRVEDGAEAALSARDERLLAGVR